MRLGGPGAIRGGLVAVLACCCGAAFAGDRWVHIRVHDGGGSAENVNINVPLEMAATMLSGVEARGLSGGKLRLDQADLEGIDLRAVLAALRDAPDAEFLTVKAAEQNIRLAKEGDELVMRVDERAEAERVRIRVPLALLRALLEGEDDELDVAAALRVLDSFDGDLLRVDAGEQTSVRIWIDSREAGR